DAVVALTEPMQARTKELLSDSAELDRLLALGAEKASEIAEQTLADVYQKLGFIPRR
ncbi:MAG: tryptophan--tRNA ligase, partial [Actinobacteria bacterium]|nr:tryptophan--tRNA ligase [Actinomycetota bacterium]